MILGATLVIILTLTSDASTSKNDVEEFTIPRDWVDPGDMLRYDGNAGIKDTSEGKSQEIICDDLKSQLLQCRKDLEDLPMKGQTCPLRTEGNSNVPPCDTPYFKKITRKVLENLELRGEHEVVVKASQEETETLKKFVDSQKGNVQDVCEVIMDIISNFRDRDDLHISSWWDPSSFSYITKEAILLFVVFLAILAVVIAFEIRTQLSWGKQFCCILFLCFVISIPWTWFHLYRKAFASKQANMAKDIPKHCQADHELRPLESISMWLKSAFTFADDPCITYQETLLVDPVWEISPLKAVSATMANALTQPLEHFAEATGKSFRVLFKEVPIQWQPFVFGAFIFIIIVGMFTLSGLQIRLPFITITTVPALPGNVQGGVRQLQQQVQNVEVVLQQLNNSMVQRNAIDHPPGELNDRQAEVLQLLQEIHRRQAQWQDRFLMARPPIKEAEVEQIPIMEEERPAHSESISGLKHPTEDNFEAGKPAKSEYISGLEFSIEESFEARKPAQPESDSGLKRLTENTIEEMGPMVD